MNKIVSTCVVLGFDMAVAPAVRGEEMRMSPVEKQPFSYLAFISEQGEYRSELDGRENSMKFELKGDVVRYYSAYSTSAPSTYFRCLPFENKCSKCAGTDGDCSQTYSDELQVCANGDVKFTHDNFRIFLDGYSRYDRTWQPCDILVPDQPMARQQVDQYLLLTDEFFWLSSTWAQAPSGYSYVSAKSEARFLPDRTLNEKVYRYKGTFPDGHLVVTDDVDYIILTDNVGRTISRTVVKISAQESFPGLQVGTEQHCNYDKFYHGEDHYKLTCPPDAPSTDYMKSYD